MKFIYFTKINKIKKDIKLSKLLFLLIFPTAVFGSGTFFPPPITVNVSQLNQEKIKKMCQENSGLDVCSKLKNDNGTKKEKEK